MRQERQWANVHICQRHFPSPLAAMLRYYLLSWQEWQREEPECKRDSTTCTIVSWLFFLLNVAPISEASLYKIAIQYLEYQPELLWLFSKPSRLCSLGRPELSFREILPPSHIILFNIYLQKDYKILSWIHTGPSPTPTDSMNNQLAVLSGGWLGSCLKWSKFPSHFIDS